MVSERINAAKKRVELAQLKAQIAEIPGVYLVCAFSQADASDAQLKLLNRIIKAEYPVSFIRERGGSAEEYVEHLYKKLDLSATDVTWLLPNVKGGVWWIELKIADVCGFIRTFLAEEGSINLTVFDLTNNILFDIENGENEYEYRILRL